MNNNPPLDIRDPAVDIDHVMAQVREAVARRRAASGQPTDLDQVGREVFAAEGARPAADITRALLDTPPPRASRVVATIPTWRDLNAQWMIREQPFVSHAPVVGPLIVRVRNGWNWMSTKWYVRPLVQQISAFNLSVVRAFQDVDQHQQQVADRLRQLEALTQQQAAEITTLRQELALFQVNSSTRKLNHEGHEGHDDHKEE
jgi:hypothetical protein